MVHIFAQQRQTMINDTKSKGEGRNHVSEEGLGGGDMCKPTDLLLMAN